jgi:hypothetical protein
MHIDVCICVAKVQVTVSLGSASGMIFLTDLSCNEHSAMLAKQASVLF